MSVTSPSRIDTSTFSGLREYHYLASLMLSRSYQEFRQHLEHRSHEILDKYNELSTDDKNRTNFELNEIDIQLTAMLNYAMLP